MAPHPSSPRARRALALAALLCPLFAACGGGGGAPTSSADKGSGSDPVAPTAATRHGVVVIEERAERFHLDAWFTEAEAPAAAETLDRCETRSALVTQPVSAPSPRRLSVGDAVEIGSRGGAWARLERQRGGAETLYATELRSVRDEWPDDALLSAPGEEFPEVPVLALAPLAPLELLVPDALRDLPEDRRVVWQAGEDPRDRIALVLRDQSAGGTGDPRVDVLCTLVDDGEFVVPVDALPFARPWISRVARVRETRVAVAPDAMLIVEQLSER